jgi:hypothetical protein
VPRSFVALLVAGGVLLVATTIPGVFTVDEDHYMVTVLALRAGQLTAPGTGGLPPSRSLLYFDPYPYPREIETTPVSPTAPPLYALLALPFSAFGWRGLVAVNTLAFLGAAALCFVYTRRYGGSERAGWLAAGAFALGGFGLEYAQGLWPHALAMCLGFAGLVLAARVRDGAGPALAAASGVLVGLAAGVRYQNVVLAALVGAGIALFAPRRLRASLAFAVGVALPLGAASLMNHARLDAWNPVSKGLGYMESRHVSEGGYRLVEAGHTVLAQVVDFSLRPALSPRMQPFHEYMHKDPASGAFVIEDSVKKAWLQSSPWLAVALVALLLATVAFARERGRVTPRQRELVAGGIVVAGMLAIFARSGFGRTDGLCFNQRYLFELTPIAAVALAWALDDLPLRLREGLVGAGVALAAALAVTRLANGQPFEFFALMNAPLVLGAGLLFVWLRARRGAPAVAALSLLLGASFGWAAGVHLGEDVATSRRFRHLTRSYRDGLVVAGVPDHAALFTVRGDDDWFGPIQLERDVVIVDPRLDAGAAAPATVAALLDQGRRVFVSTRDFPPPLFHAMAAGREVRALPPVAVADGHPPLLIVEILAGPPPGSPPRSAS